MTAAVSDTLHRPAPGVAPDAPQSPTPEQALALRRRLELTQAEMAALFGYGARERWAEIESGKITIDPYRWVVGLHVAGVERIAFGVTR